MHLDILVPISVPMCGLCPNSAIARRMGTRGTKVRSERLVTMPAPGHEPFLRAICENPDDDAPRLIYADWLDENGDSERAEFIRLQIGISGRDDAVEALSGRVRCEELFRKNHHRWIEALPGSAALWSKLCIDSIRGPRAIFGEVHEGAENEVTSVAPIHRFEDWERGFPTAVYVQSSSDDVSLPYLEKVGELVPIHRLRVITCPNENVFFTMLSLSPFLSKIRELIVPHNITLRDLTVTAMANSPHVKHLRQFSIFADYLVDSTGIAIANSKYLQDIEMLHLLRNQFSEPVRAALRARFGFAVFC